MSELPLVVGAVIVDRFPNSTRVLAARRTRPADLAGQWEFPGGKVEPGESPQEALRREIAEELGVAVDIQGELRPPTGHTWPASNGYRMRLFLAVIDRGRPQPQDGHDMIRWLARDQLTEVEWLASDHGVLSTLPI